MRRWRTTDTLERRTQGLRRDILLDVQGVSVEFTRRKAPAVRVVDDVSFSVRRGEILGIVGESGSGKTTLCLAIAGSLPPGGMLASGRVWLAGKELTALEEAEWRNVRGKRLGFIPQEAFGALNPVRNVRSQMREMRRDSVRETDKAAVSLLQELMIPETERILRSYPHELSGGLRQRVITATVRLGNPELIIADEPTTALDVINQAQLLKRLRVICDEQGTSFILITHDMGVVAAICDSVVVMYAGLVVEAGPVKRIFEHPAHPYTQALMRCVPRLGFQPDRLPTIPGEPPIPEQLHLSCPFAVRCPKVMPVCYEEKPLPVGVEDQHWAACWAVESSPLHQQLDADNASTA